MSGECLPQESIELSVPSHKYCPITSVDVEMYFSAYKFMLTDNRRSLTQENLEKLRIVYCKNSLCT